MATFRSLLQFSKCMYALKKPLLSSKQCTRKQILRPCSIATSAIGETLERTCGVYASDLKLFCGENHVEINGVAKEPLTFHYQWLRFHCRCDKCFNHSTQQRVLTVLDVDQYPKPKECHLNDNQLVATWEDGHTSHFDLSWLARYSHDSHHERLVEVAKQRKLWQGPQNAAKISYKEFITNRNARKDVMQSLLEYGVAFVNEVNASVEATEDTVRALAPIQHTFFGGVWEFGTPEDEGPVAHRDSAYTNQALGPHTDNSYLTESSGLQVFHCLSTAVAGGESILVDGFAAAERLKSAQPVAYDLLASTIVPFKYVEPGHSMANLATVLDLHPLTKDLRQIRFNPYDLAPLSTMSQMSAARWMNAWRHLSEEINSKNAPWRISLRPGTVLFIDNWRILHGRDEYQGMRHMTGCYIARSDFLSAARVAGALPADT